jgi:acetate kinase
MTLVSTTDLSKIANRNAPESHKLVFDMFVDRIIGFVGAYYVELGCKVDALVFAGGIGGQSPLLRERVVLDCSCLGITID